MPIYEYELRDGGECKGCGGRFTLRRPLDRPALEHCPLCRKPVRKIISQISVPRLTKSVSLIDAKKAGFTVFHRVGPGEYERQ